MPELPEVETVRRGLVGALVGRTITRVVVHEARLRWTLPATFGRTLTGRSVTAVRRRGKYLLLDLDDGGAWLVHFGMSGTFVVRRPEAPSRGPDTHGMSTVPSRLHTHVTATLADGSLLQYHDPRRFGFMRLGRPDELEAALHLGPEPLSDAFSPALLHATAHRQRRAIKSLLMDQRIVAGLGNIYVNEILFSAGVRPTRRTSRLTRPDAFRIVAATQEIIGQAITLRGSSISDYRDERGEPGAFQDTFRVYERAGETCRRCDAIIKKSIIIGRSSFYCPRCQR